MTVRQYYWDDPGAPQISYTANTFNDVMSACLVNGYGTGDDFKEGAGWTEVYSSGDRRVFQQGSGNMRFFEFYESGYYVYQYGYDTFDVVNGTGTNRFPVNAARLAAKTYSTSTSDYRPWAVICTDKSIYFQIFYNNSYESDTDNFVSTTFVGDFISFVPNDAWNSLIIASYYVSTSSSYQHFGENLSCTSSGSGFSLRNDYIGVNLGSSRASFARSFMSDSAMGASGLIFPDPATGSIVLEPVKLMEYPSGDTSSRIIRGQMPGLFNPLHDRPATHRSTFPGQGAMSGYDVVLWTKGKTNGRIAFSTNPADWT